MRLSKKQHAILNWAVRPFKLTTNILGAGLEKLTGYYAKYYAKRRISFMHQKPAYKNCTHRHYLTVRYNRIVRRFGYSRLFYPRPSKWTFYGNEVLTKYGHRQNKKRQKWQKKRARKRRLKRKEQKERDRQAKVQKALDKPVAFVCLSDDSNSEQKKHENVEELNSTDAQDTAETVPIVENTQQAAPVAPVVLPTHEDSLHANDDALYPDDLEKDTDADGDVIDNIWNLDIQKVAAIITENAPDDNPLDECKSVIIFYVYMHI